MDPGPLRIRVVSEALEEIGISEVTADITKKGEESAFHLGKCAAVPVTELRITMLGPVTIVPAPLTVEEDRTTGN